MTDRQRILLSIALSGCDPIDATLDKRRRNQQGDAFGCVLAAHDELAQPFRIAEGQEVPIDERFWTIATPAVIDDQMFIGAGYFVMLEPLGPGDHRIEWGAFRVAQDVIDTRSIVNVHVKEAAAE